MGAGGRRELGAADIRRALRLYWIADALLIALLAALASSSSGEAEEGVEVEVGLEVAGEGVEGRRRRRPRRLAPEAAAPRRASQAARWASSAKRPWT